MNGLQLHTKHQHRSTHGRVAAREALLESKKMAGVTYIIVGQQVERAECLVIVEVKGSCSFEIATERRYVGRLDDFFGAPNSPGLPVLLRGSR